MKYLIVGLGNIGDEYADTRHNIGFIVASALADSLKSEFSSDRYASVANLKYRGRKLVVIKPSTYMNLSGKAVRYWLEKEKINPDKLLIITDDVALPIAEIRLRIKGGDGGHNGLGSIIETLGSNNFNRLRIGIGNSFAKGYQSDYVLGRWTKTETELMIKKMPFIIEAVQSFVMNGMERTMNHYNTRSKDNSD